ncbi:MAG: hypothetical protein NXH75_10025 [Halobacteriovoraceae bacterium]|nr:hypothetical protein [Halobacteriovoraceae bacterium]
MKKIAAFDIGSNAIRMAIGQVDKEGVLTVIDRIRRPLRLGTEAFSKGEFSSYTMEEALKVFKSFKKEIDYHEAELFRAVATSAYRNSSNGKELGKKILEETGIFIEEIDGKTEAALIRKALQTRIDLTQKDYLLFDIGGGSAEVTFLEKGEPKGATSFPVGTVRLLELGKAAQQKGGDFVEAYNLYLEEIGPQLEQFFKEVYPGTKPLRIIGTGGNFKRLTKLRKKILGKKNINFILPEEVPMIREALEETPYLKRIKKFGLRPDRADVIIPAIYIMEKVMDYFPAKKILTPDVGLIHGLLFSVAGDSLKRVKDSATDHPL